MDKASELIVGDDDCPYTDVVNALLTPASSVIVANEWRKLTRELQLTDLTINEIEKQQVVENKRIDDILHYILAKWRASTGIKATLETLISSVTALGWQNVADKLKVAFDKVEQSNTVQVKETLPSPISYYVQRRLTTRSLLKPEIFKEKTKDIFVYFGKIERHQVTKLANGNLTDSSRNQVYKVNPSVKHILLQQFGDWGRLREKATKDPIHLIHCHFDEEKFRWIESKGNVSLPQKFVKVEEEQDEYLEDKFQEFVLDKTIYPLRRKLSVIIADSPGMGKSVLLSQMARSLKDSNSNLQIIFIVIGNFVKEVQKKLVCERRPTETHKLSAILESLSNYFSDPASALQMMTSSENHKNATRLELLFDGFDEIDENDFDLAYECLSMLAQLKQDIRLWVTTRPHLMHKLEQRLGVPGYNIIPFTRAEQEGFLEKFWSQCQKGDLELDNVKLQRFIKGCLDKLDSLLKSPQNKYIAGIPLQCMLLAEAFEKEALEFADRRNEAINFDNELCQIQINNITDMYKLLISNRFQKYFQTFGASAEETPRLMQVHVYFALQLIFPQCHALLEKLSENKRNVEELLNVGILETCSDTEPPRFIHRTVAEYFISWFLVSHLSSAAKLHPVLQPLIHLIHLALETHPNKGVVQINYWIKFRIDSSNFKHEGICLFANSLLDENGEFVEDEVIKLLFSAPDESKILQMLQASMNNHCFCICKMLHKIIPQIWNNPGLMQIAVSVSSVDFLRFLYTSLKGQLQPLCQIRLNDPEISALHIGVSRGNFNIVEYLLHQQGFAQLVKSKAHSMRNLMHLCFFNTKNAPAREVQERIQIMQILLVEDSLLLHYKWGRKSVILSPAINVNLLLELVRLEANLLETDKHGDNFLFVAQYHLSDSDLCTLLSSIPSETLKALIKSGNRLGETILHIMVESYKCHTNAIKFLLNAGADPKAQTKEGLSVLMLALYHPDNPNGNTLKSLVDASVYTDVLHQAASAGNLKLVERIIDIKKLDVNSRNSDGKTPFESAVYGKRQELGRYDVAIFLKTRNAILDSQNEGCKMLHDRILNGDIVGVKILLELCKMVTNSKSDSGCTPLHLVFGTYVTGFDNNRIRTEIGEMLVKHGANVNSQNLQGESPLEFAICHHPDSLTFKLYKLLVDRGAEISEEAARALLLWLCVQAEAGLSDPDMIRYMNQLLECSKSPIPVITEGDNTIDFKKNSVINYLLLQGWNINSVDDYGRSILQYAVYCSNDVKKLRYFFDLGVNPQLKTNNGFTLLHTCVSLGRINALECLLNSGQLDINAKNDDGDTPLHCAVNAPVNKRVVTQLLLKCGADSTVLNKTGETPRDIAIRHGAEHKYLSLFDAKRRKLAVKKS